MTPAEQSSAVLQNCIDRLQFGDESAREQLIEVSSARLRVLARQLLADDRVRRWEDTDDVLQEALVTLHRSLQSGGRLAPAQAHVYDASSIIGSPNHAGGYCRIASRAVII